MKKLFSLFLIVLCLSVAAFALAEEYDFGELSGLDEFLAGITDENPIVNVHFMYSAESHDREFSSCDPEIINAVLEELDELEITGTTDMDVTDWYPMLSLLSEDGNSCNIDWNGEWLDVDGVHYELEGIKSFFNAMNKLIDQSLAERRTITLNGTDVDLLSITLADFEAAGFTYEYIEADGVAYITHPDYNGGMTVGITGGDLTAPLAYVNLAFAEDLPVLWCGQDAYTGLDFWENELFDLLVEAYSEDEMLWELADFYYPDSKATIRFWSKGDAPLLEIMRD